MARQQRTYVATVNLNADLCAWVGEKIGGVWDPEAVGHLFIDGWEGQWEREDGAVRYAIGQLERGEQGGNYHIQAYIEFTRPVSIMWCHREFTLLHGAHLEPRMGTREQARDYCRKEQTRLYGPAEFGDFGAGGQGKRSDLELFGRRVLDGASDYDLAQETPGMFLQYGRYVQTLRRAGEAPEGAETGFEPRPWQQHVLNLLTEAPDDRHIIWVYDSDGGKGKSRLAGHLIRNYGAILLEGKLADMAYMYNKERIAIFDITRAQAETSKHLYSVAEKLKNGFINSTKYESCMKRFKPPHVIFFSNSMPETGQWSADRVILINLNTWQPPAQEAPQDGSQAAPFLFLD